MRALSKRKVAAMVKAVYVDLLVSSHLCIIPLNDMCAALPLLCRVLDCRINQIERRESMWMVYYKER